MQAPGPKVGQHPPAGKPLGLLPLPAIALSDIAPWLPADQTLTPAGLSAVHEHGVLGVSGHLE